jgi:small subunit ribosomal protein S21
MPNVVVKSRESFEAALRRFKKECQKEGILSEVRKRKHYEKPSVRKALAAKRRALKRMRKVGQRR